MNKLTYFLKENASSLILLIILIASRLIPHPPNFTPIISVAIISGIFFKNFKISIIILFLTMLISDIFLGFHNNMFFVYFSLAFITYFFSNPELKTNYKNLIIFSFLGSLIFFIISNFGVWFLSDIYSKNPKGILECYVMAIPFFKNTFISTVFFSILALSSKNYLSQKLNLKVTKL